jgi:ATP-binding cassette subfamily C protein LapB
MDDQLTQGARDGGDRPTVQSLRNRLRAECEISKGTQQSPKKSWLKRKAKSAKLTPVTPSPPAHASAPSGASAASQSPFDAPTAPGEMPVQEKCDARSRNAEESSWSKPGIGPVKEKISRLSQVLAWFAGKAKERPKAKEKTAAKEWPTTKEGPIVKEDSKVGNLHSFLDIFKEGLHLPAPIIVASVISSFLGLALPLAVLQIYDRILPNRSIETLTLLTLGLFAVFALDALLKIMRSYLLGWSAVHSGFNAQLTAVTRLLWAPHAKVEEEPPAIWVDRLEAVRELSAFEGGQSRLLTLDIPLAGIFLIVLGLVGGSLIIVPILLIAGFGMLAVIHGSRLQQVLANRSEQDNRKHDFLVECLSGIHTLKGLAMEPMILRRFERLQKGSAVASYATILLGNNLQSLGILFSNLMMISVVSVGALLVMAGKLSIGGLACCSLLSGRLTQPVLRGIHMWTEFQNIKLAQERAGKLNDFEVGTNAEISERGELTGAIELTNVGFQYSGSNKSGCLTGISLQMHPGEFVGIKGESGSGRSTLVKLITGELKPTTGSVNIGGLETQPEREYLRGKDVAYISASSAILRGTILENITMFRTGAAVEAAQKAAKLIGLEAAIYHLPDGYDTPLAQGVAQELPSGMLQRIFIARALARKPKILIFDEANSLLDFQSDMALRQGLMSLKGAMTAIIISNRPSFLAIADRVYALNEGTLELQPEREETSTVQTSAQGSAA